ncbi:MAG: gamma-glutamyltransferase [Alphaproteobacteria bacterium]
MVVSFSSPGLRRLVRRAPSGCRRSAAAALAVVAGMVLSACGLGSDTSVFSRSLNDDFVGMAAASEPEAALVARNILRGGGNAADAAVAGSLALAVTYPAGVSLGAGGRCLVIDGQAGRSGVLEFPAAGAAGVGLPALVRGLAVLHDSYGEIKWQGLTGPAVRLAGGVAVSRTLAAALAANSRKLADDPLTAALFLDGSGQPLQEGDRLVQPALRRILGQIQFESGGILYTGQSGRTLALTLRDMGLAVTAADLAAVQATWGAASAAGAVDGRLRWLAAGQATGAAATGTRHSGGGIVTADGSGMVVVCGLSLGAPFGTGVTVPDWGFLLAEPAVTTSGTTALAAELSDSARTVYSAVAVIGDAAAAERAQGLLARLGDGAPAAAALAATVTAATQAVAFHCPDGVASRAAPCAIAADPPGLALLDRR